MSRCKRPRFVQTADEEGSWQSVQSLGPAWRKQSQRAQQPGGAGSDEMDKGLFQAFLDYNTVQNEQYNFHIDLGHE